MSSWIACSSNWHNGIPIWNNLIKWLFLAFLCNDWRTSKLTLIISFRDNGAIRGNNFLWCFENGCWRIRWSEWIIWSEFILISVLSVNERITVEAIKSRCNFMFGYMFKFCFDWSHAINWRINNVFMLIDNYITSSLSQFIGNIASSFCLFKSIYCCLLAVLGSNWIVCVIDGDLLERVPELLVDLTFLLFWWFIVSSLKPSCGHILIVQEERKHHKLGNVFHFIFIIKVLKFKR